MGTEDEKSWWRSREWKQRWSENSRGKETVAGMGICGGQMGTQGLHWRRILMHGLLSVPDPSHTLLRRWSARPQSRGIQNCHFMAVSTAGQFWEVSFQFVWWFLAWQWWNAQVCRKKTAKLTAPEYKTWYWWIFIKQRISVFCNPLFEKHYRLYCALKRSIMNKRRNFPWKVKLRLIIYLCGTLHSLAKMKNVLASCPILVLSCHYCSCMPHVAVEC